MRAVFVDANDTLAAVTDKLLGVAKLPVGINRNLLLNDETKGFLSALAHRADAQGQHFDQHRARRGRR